ncbi:MAG TPA: hypothetical protein VJX16_26245 [Terriglobales bacterium]|nr:hypothetical protein [Terriglobales bacterium]
MRVWRNRLLVSATVVSLWTVTASGDWRADQLASLRQPPDVRDESDPKDTRSCYAMGQLEISYRSQESQSPTVGVLVTDPRGRRIGYDPAGPNAWQELPLAQAFIDCADQNSNGRPRACTGWIQICGPLSGTYKLQVVASENSEYSIDVSAVSRQKRDDKGFHATESRVNVRSLSIRKGAQDTLLLEYSREPGSKVALTLRENAPLAKKQTLPTSPLYLPASQVPRSL